jgi:hypothetical protein
MGSTENEANDDRWWPPFDEVWQAAAGAGCAIAALASSPFAGAACQEGKSAASEPAHQSRAHLP